MSIPAKAGQGERAPVSNPARKVFEVSIMLTISEKGYAFVACREACVLTAYPDSRMLAVGFGQNDPSLKEGDTITMDEAIALFLKEGQRIAAFLEKTFGPLQQQQADALWSLTYNVGTGTIRDNAPLVAVVKAYVASPKDGRLRDAVGYQILQTHPKDKPVPFNLSRRCREALVFVSGDYGDLRTMMLWPAGKSPKHTPPDPAQVVPMPTFLKG